MKNRIAGFILTLSILLLAHSAWAGDDTTAQKPTITAVLVQLRTEHNRISAMEKNHAYRRVEEVKKDALAVRTLTIKDFTNYFKKCPVYYFMDTNSELIVKKHFDGVLLDASLNPCNCHPEEPYLIVNWGYPTETRHGTAENDTANIVASSGAPYGKGLIINNEKFHQLTYLYILRYQTLVMKRSKQAKPYIYESKHYDIDYFPVANKLNNQLDNLSRSYNTSWHGLWDPYTRTNANDTIRHK